MSAILGGADAVCNIPYDAIYHKTNEFAERIARNQLIVLKEESYFDKTNNPSDGSYYIESLTKQLADKALELFKELEKAGGFLSQLKTNTIQKKIKESAQKEQDLFDTKKEILVGTNKYQSSLDKMKGDLELFPFTKNKPRKSSIEPIIERRLAEELEQQRLENE
jgi:methylmalonyl-CoA mutase